MTKLHVCFIENVKIFTLYDCNILLLFYSVIKHGIYYYQTALKIFFLSILKLYALSAASVNSMLK